MSTGNPVQIIGAFLNALPPTGAKGFEGLVATLLEAQTGQRFRLSASGQQHGQDASSDIGPCNRIKVETKRYSAATLDLRELGSEIQQATVRNDCDLWVLAASCELEAQKADELNEIGRSRETEVLILDLGRDGLPRVVVLAAAQATKVESWLGLHSVKADLPAIRAALSAVVADQRFPDAIAQITNKLNGTLLGYADARARACFAFLRTVMDTGNSVAKFNQRLGVLDKVIPRIERGACNANFDLWWNSGKPSTRHAVALGEEGTGKTWASIAWIAQAVEKGRMPLVLPFSANAETLLPGDSVEAFLPRLLAKWVEGNVASWSKRLTRWLDDPSDAPLLVLVADGLNEKSSIAWPSFFRQLNEERWRRHVCVLATDRPGHWTPHCAQSGLDGFLEIAIGGYTDQELEQALKGRGIDVSTLPRELLGLIRRPRYCELVADHFQQMKQDADFSVERLIFLDIKQRCAQKRGRSLTADQFIEIITALAKKYRNKTAVSPVEIRQLISAPDQEGRIYQEILDGGLTVKKGHAIQLEPTRLVYGLGMLLAEEVREAALTLTGAQLEDAVAKWFEPHPEMDMKVSVCASAIFHALIDDGYPSSGKRELLRFWLGLRNWSEDTQETSTDYVLRCPAEFFEILEDFWTARRDRGAAQEFFARALIRHRDHPRIQPALIDATRRWMGFIHPAGDRIFRGDAKWEEKARRTIQENLGRAVKVGETLVVGGVSLHVVDDDGLLRLRRFALLMISSGARLPFAPALFAWALSSAAMDTRMEADEAAWTLRYTSEDLESSFVARAEQWAAAGKSVELQAAHQLMTALGTRRAQDFLRREPIKTSPAWQKLLDQHASDPCTSGFAWSDDDCMKCMIRDDVNIMQIIGRIGERILRPGFDVPSSLVARANKLLSSIDPLQIRSQMGYTREMHALDRVTPLLALKSPMTLADYIRSLFRTWQARQLIGQRQLAYWMEKHSPLLTRKEIDEANAARGELLKSAANWRGNGLSAAESDRRTTEAFIFLGISPRLPPVDLLKQLLARPRNAIDLLAFETWFDRANDTAIELARRTLHDASDVTIIVRALWFLSHTAITLSDTDRARITELAASNDDLVRGAACRLAALVGDVELGRAIANQGRSFCSQPTTWEMSWGAQLLINHSAHMPFDSVLRRLHPSTAGFLLEPRGNKPEEAVVYGRALDALYHRILAASPPASGLPAIEARPTQPQLHVELPEFQDDPKRGVTFRDASTSWGSSPDSGASAAQALKATLDESADAYNKRMAERISNLYTAWGTEALQWYGRPFSEKALETVFDANPAMVKTWVAAGVKSTATGRQARVRLGSLYAALCPVLIRRAPPLGWELWRVLRDDKNGPIHFDVDREAFNAPESVEADNNRRICLDQCTSDEELSHVALCAEHAQRTTWLKRTAQDLVQRAPLYEKAKGLALVSLSNFSSSDFDDLVAMADVACTWLEKQMPTLKMNVARNEWAQHWYAKYFAEPDVDTSWSYLTLALECADDRFWTWNERVEANGDADKVRHVRANYQYVRQKIREDNKRNETLFGIKIRRGEIFPFVQ